jgi:hypothetical protein
MESTNIKIMSLEVTDIHSKHIPERVINANGTAIMWDISVTTDGAILENWSYVVLHDKKKEKTWLLVDIAITDDSNVNTK